MAVELEELIVEAVADKAGFELLKDASRLRPWTDYVAALVIFIFYHRDLLHASNPAIYPIFTSLQFTVLAAILGVACQEALLQTGSVWPGVVMHWLWVWL